VAFEPLIQDPMSVGLKNASPEGNRLFRLFVSELNGALVSSGRDRLWYQPDNAQWQFRYFWMFHYKSDLRDFITRVEFVSKDTIFVDFSHFGARIPKEVEFMLPELYNSLEYKGFPPHVVIRSDADLRRVVPLVADHYLRVLEHLLDRKGKLALRGCSHIELALKPYLMANDHVIWSSWERLDFLGRRDVDLASLTEKIAIEVQGDYWHNREGQRDRDLAKKADLLANGWSLIWAWESGIKTKFHRVAEALARVRHGERFVEIIKDNKKPKP
jgi:very-short-patch-repair endonuclease